MQYQDCVAVAQAAEESGPDTGAPSSRLTDANINPATGLASDYLNHFNEAIMLLEMLSSCPDCRDDFLEWRPKTYREHFAASHFKGRAMAIAAYETADPGARRGLDALADAMTAVLEATRKAMSSGMPSEGAGDLGRRAAAQLRPLVARAGAIINGVPDTAASHAPQALVDGLMKR
jgi:hypothetical protein